MGGCFLLSLEQRFTFSSGGCWLTLPAHTGMDDVDDGLLAAVSRDFAHWTPRFSGKARLGGARSKSRGGVGDQTS